MEEWVLQADQEDLEYLVRLETQASMEALDPLELKDLQDFLVYRATMEDQGKMGHKEHLAHQDNLVQREGQVLQGHQVLLVTLAFLVRLGKQETLV